MTSFDLSSVTQAVDVARRAPSVHNTQPWRWVLTDDGLLVAPDEERHLTVADPDRHSMNISCGAAVALTEIALAAQGWRTSTTVNDDGSALITADGKGDPDPQAQARVDAALARRSDRRQFSQTEVSEEQIETLRAAAHSGTTRIEFPHSDDQRIMLAVAVSWADRQQRDDEAYQAEMQRWLRDTDVHHPDDGIPLSSVPHLEPGRPRRVDIPQRDFEVGVTGGELVDQDVTEKPLIAVVLTEGDRPLDHIRAGAAMMRLLIAAQRQGLSSCIMSQAVDLPAFRARVQNLMGWTGHPQSMARIGIPSAPVDQIPLTPRRPVDAVLFSEVTP